MRFPKKLDILGHKFAVKYVDRIENDKSMYGVTYPIEKRIEIASLTHETQPQVVSTLIHEYLHGSLHMSGFAVLMTEQQEEALVTMLTYAVEALIPQINKIHSGQPTSQDPT